MKKLPAPLVRSVLIIAVAGVGWGLLSVFGVFEPGMGERLEAARKALLSGDHDSAETSALAIIKEDPKQYEAWVIAGVAAIAHDDFETALKRFDEVPDNDTPVALQARLRSGDMLLNKAHRLSAAEDQFLRAYRQQEPPRNGVEPLALLLGIGSRYHEQVPLLLELVRDEKFNNLHLYLIHGGRDKPVNPESIPLYATNDPDDPAPQLAQAQQEVLTGNFVGAISILRRLIEAHPELAEAHAKLGLALLADGRQKEVPAWDRQLSKSAEDHADVWVVRGDYAQSLDQPNVAIRCYWEAVRRDPNNMKSCLPLARLLSEEEGESESAEAFRKRVETLKEFSLLIDNTQASRESANLRKNSEVAESLGLIWEAFGWSHMALRLDVNSDWAKDRTSRLRTETKDLPLVRTAPGRNPADIFDLSRFPLPAWNLAQ
jgi:tetratricopeptide (TPR) repeat protein